METLEECMSNRTPDCAAPQPGVEPFEIERKFLIEYPDISWLESQPECRRVEIVQTYLAAKPGEEVRVRQWCENGSCRYFRTVKRPVSAVKRVEVERELTREEYLALLSEADPALQPLHKTRYRLSREGQCFEIDIYPFWKDKAILEIELSDEKQEIHFPKELKILKEVTGEEEYKNASLARSNPHIR